DLELQTGRRPDLAVESILDEVLIGLVVTDARARIMRRADQGDPERIGRRSQGVFAVAHAVAVDREDAALEHADGRGMVIVADRIRSRAALAGLVPVGWLPAEHHPELVVETGDVAQVLVIPVLELLGVGSVETSLAQVASQAGEPWRDRQEYRRP